MNRTAAQIASTSASRRAPPTVAAPPAPPVDLGKQIQVYRGTKSDQVKVGGGYGG